MQAVCYKEFENMQYNQSVRVLAVALREAPREVRERFLCALVQLDQFSFEDFNMTVSDLSQAQAEIELIESRGEQLLTVADSDYPRLLAQLVDPPLAIHVRGQFLRGDFTNGLAVVGSRQASVEGVNIARSWSRELARSGCCIVSGLAYGVDGEAHAGALESASAWPTIAVLGQGLDTEIYPRSHKYLAEKILNNNGSIISQFPRVAKPLPHNFLNRNRVISGLADICLVIQAGEKSGSLVTARCSAELGRSVLVVPGSIQESLYAGSLNLIKQGASLVSNTKEILEYFPNLEVVSQKRTSLTGLNKELYDFIQPGQQFHYADLLSKFTDQSQLALALSELELMGYVVQQPGGFHSRNI